MCHDVCAQAKFTQCVRRAPCLCRDVRWGNLYERYTGGIEHLCYRQSLLKRKEGPHKLLTLAQRRVKHSK